MKTEEDDPDYHLDRCRCLVLQFRTFLYYIHWKLSEAERSSLEAIRNEFSKVGIERTKEMEEAEERNWVEEDYWIEEWKNWKSDRSCMKVEG